MRLSKTNIELIKIYNKGYRIINGEIYNPNGNIIKGKINKEGYRLFHISKYDSFIFVHRLVAYQKYGNKIFENGIETRHFDGNKLNNFDENILIGTASENQMDIPKKIRIKRCVHRKYDYEKVKKYYNNTKSYKETMIKFNITSKGTLYHILKNKQNEQVSKLVEGVGL